MSTPRCTWTAACSASRGTRAQARGFLERLSDRTHEVFSGIALIHAGAVQTGVARTEVTFRRLDQALIDWYLDSGEWEGRAGGYAVQGRGSALIKGHGW